MTPEIQLCTGERQLILSRYDFIVEQTKKRILNNFENIEQEAKEAADKKFAQLNQATKDPQILFDAVDSVTDHGLNLLWDLGDLRTQTTLGALASLYHHWDKTFRKFLVRELSHFCDITVIEGSSESIKLRQFYWKQDIDKIYQKMQNFGWNAKEEIYFQSIDACRLIVNVYKHGKGNSLRDLAKDYPQYLKGHDPKNMPISHEFELDHEQLEISEREFDELSNGLRCFWEEFPARLHLIRGKPY